MKLLLIRHGMTNANEAHLYCGSTDLPLSEGGREKLVRLREDGIYPDVSRMRFITSGMLRCRQTLQILFGECESEDIPALVEMDFGAFEMRSYEQLKNDPDYIRWISDDNEKNIAPGGESGDIMTRRVLGALDGIIFASRDTLAVVHGGTIAAIMAHLFPDENRNRCEWQPAPGHGYSVCFSGTTPLGFTAV